METRRIIQQPEALTLSDSDYLVADNANLGTRKISFGRLLSGATPLPPGYINGFTTAKVSATSFSVTSGYVRSADNTRNIILSSSLVKDLSQTFDIGNGGCMPDGLTLQADTKYYIFAISNSNGDVDIIVDTQQDCSNGFLDSNVIANHFDKYAVIGSVKTNSISEILEPSGDSVLIESYYNDGDWYRVWSDGWCEQGGIAPSATATIQLLKTYVDTNYVVLFQGMNQSAGANPSLTTQNKAKSSFTISGTSYYGGQPGTPCMWFSAGYIEN